MVQALQTDYSVRQICETLGFNRSNTLKEEEVYLNDYKDIHEARVIIRHSIIQVYSRKRPHSVLGYLTPVEFQQKILS